MLEEIEQLEKTKKKLGLSYRDLTKQLDLGSRKTIWRWLNDKSNPTSENLVKIQNWLEEREGIEI